ncbi:MAG TPA: ATP-binding cassette domain-containing protein [Tenericutes bacterium]|nr:ATP-binding cassette domain-containing protein [Mycoplasmatota bacterium]
MNKLYHKYSLGMKQKLAIAQVLMENPKIMIFDEPLNGIEEKAAIAIRKILLEEKKKGKIILIASHIKDDIENIAGIIFNIDGGEVNLIKGGNK